MQLPRIAHRGDGAREPRRHEDFEVSAKVGVYKKAREGVWVGVGAGEPRRHEDFAVNDGKQTVKNSIDW